MKKYHHLSKRICGELSLLFALSLAAEAFACWGNRPLAMGGSFTGLADDTNAIYWNPGGLGLNTGESVTQMSNMGDKNSSNYDHYFASAMQIIDRKHPERNYGSIAMAFVTNETIIDKDNYKAEYTRRNNRRKQLALQDDSPFIDRDTYIQIGYGIKPIKRTQLAIGVNFKSVTSDIDDLDDNRDTEWMDLDIGMIWEFGPHMGKTRLFSVGFLFQNIGEAKLIEAEDAEAPEMIRNFRPGFSIKPDEQTIFSAELYDTFGATEGGNNDVSQNIRVGAERWLTDYCALRAGVYHLNNVQMRAYTVGV